MQGDIVFDCGLQCVDAAEDAAPELVFGEVAEESFDHVEPTAGGRSEVKMKARVAFGPGLNRGMLVGGIVIDDQVKLLAGRRLAVDQAQELQPLLMAVARHAGGHDGAVQSVERGE